MIVGVCRITLLVPGSHSLKERRMVLRRIKDRVRNTFNVAIAEVSEGDFKDSWQSAQLGFAVVANDKVFTQSVVQKVLGFIDGLGVAKLVDDEQDYIDYGSERVGEPLGTWEPDGEGHPAAPGPPAGPPDDDEDGA
jgi:uncharacterized protein YlxP (DUF503 family)